MKTFKKVLAIVLSLMVAFSALSIGASAAGPNKIDVAFVVDTTGSMGDDIDEVKTNMINYLDDLKDSGMDFQVAIVDYRDFPERAGSEDYPYKVQCDFTSDYDTILAAITGLDLGFGGDGPETVYSGLIDGLNELTWRRDSGKTAILMGDAPALDPEPFTGYTFDITAEVLKEGPKSLEDWREFDTGLDTASVPMAEYEDRSPIVLFAIATSTASESNFTALAEATGGKSYSAYDSEQISEIIEEIIEEEIPDIIIDPTIDDSFFGQIKAFFLNLFYLITFQFDKVDWDALGGSLLCSVGVEY